MPSIYDVKPAFQNLLRPKCRKLAKAGVTANQVTLSAVVLSVFTGGMLVFCKDHPTALLILPPVLFVRMALNAIDGMLAREFKMKSKLGAILNELGDVVSDSCLYAAFAFIPDVSPVLAGVLVVAAVISEMTGVVGTQIGASRRYDGPMGKSDRAFWFGLLAFLLGVGVNIGPWVNVYLSVMTLLLLYTIYNRAAQALKEVGS